ncbi:hypothetical protein BRADI_4g21523v3 [Brachypodium distachyon]|nr:hypothetical protein BRADI_4g21523v3 [Brachypodium distachyon]
MVAEFGAAADEGGHGDAVVVRVERDGGGDDIQGAERVEEEVEGLRLEAPAPVEAAEVVRGFAPPAPRHELPQMIRAQVRVRLLDHPARAHAGALLAVAARINLEEMNEMRKRDRSCLRLEGRVEALLGEVGEEQPVAEPPRAGVLQGVGAGELAAAAAVHLRRRHVAERTLGSWIRVGAAPHAAASHCSPRRRLPLLPTPPPPLAPDPAAGPSATPPPPVPPHVAAGPSYHPTPPLTPPLQATPTAPYIVCNRQICNTHPPLLEFTLTVSFSILAPTTAAPR